MYFKSHNSTFGKYEQMRFGMLTHSPIISSVQFSSVTQLCPTLCDPMNRSIPGAGRGLKLQRKQQKCGFPLVMDSPPALFRDSYKEETW